MFWSRIVVLSMLIVLKTMAVESYIEILNIDDKNDSSQVDWRIVPPQEIKSISIFKDDVALNLMNMKGEVKTSIYFLIDTSIPMRNAYNKGAKPLLKKLIGKLTKKRHRVAIAGFDKALNKVYDFGENNISHTKALDNISVNGHRTELYRLAIEAMDELGKEKNLRKILVLISDGDFEDTTYTVDNLINEAKKNKVQILALGYRDSVKLQGILKPTTESGGKMWIANKSTHQMPNSFMNEIMPYFDSGGSFSFDKNELDATKSAKQNLVMNIFKKNNENIKKGIVVSTKHLEEEKEFSWRDYVGYVFSLFALLLGAIFMVLLRKDKKEESLEEDFELEEPIAYLVIQSGERYEISKNTTSIGKSEDNDIVIGGSYISRYHAEILYKDDEFLVSDRNSVNGIGVNSPAIGEGDGKITQAKLKDGDKIYLGPLELLFEEIG